MKTALTLLATLLASTSVLAATAYYTGQMENVTTVTGKPAIKCQYEYGGSKFYRLFPGFGICPQTVEVE